MKALLERGVRISLEAERLSESASVSAEELLSLQKNFITEEDVRLLAEKKKNEDKKAPIEAEQKAAFIPPPDFHPLAREYEPSIRIHEKLDVTGKSRSSGSVDDFVSYFRDRFQRLSRQLSRFSSRYPEAELKDIRRHEGQKVKSIVMVTDIRTTKNGNLLMEAEDLEGSFKLLFSQRDSDTFEKAKLIVRDDVIAAYGKVTSAFLIAEEFEWPDMPVSRDRKACEKDVAAAYISDIHFGSNKFIQHYLDGFVEWLHGKGENPGLAGKVKYLLVAGDIVDGIGIYPNQERELTVKDIYGQYELFDAFVSSVPDYIEVIACPGNHDAVRRGEPMPALTNEMVKSGVHAVGSPSFVSIESIDHLIYHGTSADSWISSVPKLSYAKPEMVMVECLKRRHLSTIYGGNAIVPERMDYLLIEKEPDVLHFGHVHKNGYTKYRGTLVINSGTFQNTTDFQLKQGHIPTPGRVPVYEFGNDALKTLDFSR
ncbi:MAG: metallophosphoesterase [Candidatus Micrarchaeota archaeon]